MAAAISSQGSMNSFDKIMGEAHFFPYYKISDAHQSRQVKAARKSLKESTMAPMDRLGEFIARCKDSRAQTVAKIRNKNIQKLNAVTKEI